MLQRHGAFEAELGRGPLKSGNRDGVIERIVQPAQLSGSCMLDIRGQLGLMVFRKWRREYLQTPWNPQCRNSIPNTNKGMGNTVSSGFGRSSPIISLRKPRTPEFLLSRPFS